MRSTGAVVTGASNRAEETSLKFFNQSNPHSRGLTTRFVSRVVSLVSHAVIHFAYSPESIYLVYQSSARDQRDKPSISRRCRIGSKFGDDETYAANDVVRWSFVRSERKKLYGECKRERAEDESSLVEFDITEDEACAATDGIESPLVSAVGRE